MATAASIWSAGAIGMAVAFGQWEVGIALSVINALTLRLGADAKDIVSVEKQAGGGNGERSDEQTAQH